jgi:RecA-family ATPase
MKQETKPVSLPLTTSTPEKLVSNGKLVSAVVVDHPSSVSNEASQHDSVIQAEEPAVSHPNGNEMVITDEMNQEAEEHQEIEATGEKEEHDNDNEMLFESSATIQFSEDHHPEELSAVEDAVPASVDVAESKEEEEEEVAHRQKGEGEYSEVC